MSAYKKARTELWSYLWERGMIALESEVDDVIALSSKVEEARKAEEAMHTASEVIQDSKKPTELTQ